MSKRKKPEVFLSETEEILLPLVLFVLLATVVFWGTFSLALSAINLFNIYVSSCVPAVFSALITALVLIPIWIGFFHYGKDKEEKSRR